MVNPIFFVTVHQAFKKYLGYRTFTLLVRGILEISILKGGGQAYMLS